MTAKHEIDIIWRKLKHGAQPDDVCTQYKQLLQRFPFIKEHLESIGSSEEIEKLEQIQRSVSNIKKAQKRIRLGELSKKSILMQIEKSGSVDDWEMDFKTNNVKNKKLNQFVKLRTLHKDILQEKVNVEKTLGIKLTEDELPHSKLLQYKLRIHREGINISSWTKRTIWFYTAAEWLVEKWASENNIIYYDFNITDQFHHQDYEINGIKVDVKTTMGIGRRRQPIYRSSNNTINSKEIIIGVSSWAKTTDDKDSCHYIHGIFDPSIYENINIPLRYFKLDKSLLNPCYFHPLNKYFNIQESIKLDKNKYDADVIDYCLGNELFLNAVFYLSTWKDVEKMLIHDYRLNLKMRNINDNLFDFSI